MEYFEKSVYQCWTYLCFRVLILIVMEYFEKFLLTNLFNIYGTS